MGNWAGTRNSGHGSVDWAGTQRTSTKPECWRVVAEIHYATSASPHIVDMPDKSVYRVPCRDDDVLPALRASFSSRLVVLKQ